MIDSRKRFDDLSKDFRDKPKNLLVSDLTTINDKILKGNLDQFIQLLALFTELYNEFDIKIVDNEEVVSFKAYRNRALTYMMICQNQFITPITNEFTRRNNEKLHLKATESIHQGQILLMKAKKSSVFAVSTFVCALILSVASIILGILSINDNETSMNKKSEIINNIVFKLDKMNEDNRSKIDLLNNQNKEILLKLDSVLINNNK
jgi:hypothetical protein